MATGYGVDTYCLASLQTGRLVGGRLLLAQACYRRLITPRGALQGLTDDEPEADYGLDLAGYCGATDSKDLANALGPAIRAELMDDDRVRDVATIVTRLTPRSNGLTDYEIDVRVLPVEADVDFTLTLAVNDVDVTLLGVA
jgi:hypothetical protein